MPFCPRCASEYADGVPRCLECDLPLVERRSRPIKPALEFEDLLAPAGLVVVFFAALGLLYVRFLADAGQISPPLGPMIASQPQCLTLFYALAALACGGWLAFAILRWLLRSR